VTPAPDALQPAVLRSGMDASGAAGEPATAVEYLVQAERTVGLLADALARLHRTELTDEERSLTLDAHQLAEAAAAGHRTSAAVAAAHVRSAAYAHIDDERLHAILVEGAAGAAARGDRMVLTHGSPTLANLVADRGTLVGWVDWAAAAVADPYRDLAVAARSVAAMSPSLVPLLLERYGEQSPDPIRLDWYSLLAELTGAGATSP
jgi:aminoglycoside phosphotransferase